MLCVPEFPTMILKYPSQFQSDCRRACSLCPSMHSLAPHQLHNSLAHPHTWPTDPLIPKDVLKANSIKGQEQKGADFPRKLGVQPNTVHSGFINSGQGLIEHSAAGQPMRQQNSYCRSAIGNTGRGSRWLCRDVLTFMNSSLVVEGGGRTWLGVQG